MFSTEIRKGRSFFTLLSYGVDTRRKMFSFSLLYFSGKKRVLFKKLYIVLIHKPKTICMKKICECENSDSVS